MIAVNDRLVIAPASYFLSHVELFGARGNGRPRRRNGARRNAPRGATIAAKLEELAQLGGVGLTLHAAAIERAMAAVVNDTIDKMGSTGELRGLNQAFKEAGRSTRQFATSITSRSGR